MLSAWFEYTDLYLAQGLALLKVGDRPCKAIHLPTTLPWDKACIRMGEALQEATASGARRKRIRVMLSGALCPAIAIQAPDEARSWNDLRQLLPVSSAAMLGVASEQLDCVQESGGEPVGAATSTNLTLPLRSWAQESGLTLHSLQPSWGVATQSRLSRSGKVTAMQVEELDGITLVTGVGGNWSCVHVPKTEYTMENLTVVLRRHLTGLGIEEEHLLKLNFLTEAATPLRNGPTLWTGHWGAP